MPKINLLPSDLVPKRSIIRLSVLLTKVVYAGVVIFFTFLVFFVSIVVLNSVRIKSLKSQEGNLLTAVKNYEQVEQQVILARDRMAIIKEIWKNDSLKKGLQGLGKIALILPSGVNLSEADISTSKGEITVSGSSSVDIAKFMSFLISSDIYKSVYLKSFSFNPNLGYRVTIQGFVK